MPPSGPGRSSPAALQSSNRISVQSSMNAAASSFTSMAKRVEPSIMPSKVGVLTVLSDGMASGGSHPSVGSGSTPSSTLSSLNGRNRLCGSCACASIQYLVSPLSLALYPADCPQTHVASSMAAPSFFRSVYQRVSRPEGLYRTNVASCYNPRNQRRKDFLCRSKACLNSSRR